MKTLHFLFVFLFIALVFGCNQSKIIPAPEELTVTFELTAAKMQNTIDPAFRIMIGPLGAGNPHAGLYPELKGIPDSLKNIKRFILVLDDVQAVFQAYKAGTITRNDCLNYLRNSIHNTINCTADYVRTFVVIITGISKSGTRYYLFDSNNNLDLSDEQLFSLATTVPQNQPHKVLFEKFAQGKILPDSTWISFYGRKKADGLLFKFSEQTSAIFIFDSVRYSLTVRPNWGTGIQYSSGAVYEISDTIHKEKQIFGNNQYAYLGDLYYQVVCSNDGRTISFNLDSNALKKGSTQLNMPAIPFKAVF